jgi:hypothetical protein
LLALLQKAKEKQLLPLEKNALLDSLKKLMVDDTNKTSFSTKTTTMMKKDDIKLMLRNNNPTIAGEIAYMFAISNNPDIINTSDNYYYDDEDDSVILSRTTMEFWDALLTRFEEEYGNVVANENKTKKKKNKMKIKVAAKRIRSEYNEFLSRFVYAVERNNNEFELVSLKLRIALLKDAVMKRNSGAALYTTKFALETKQLLVQYNMPSPEAVQLFQFLASNVEQAVDK